uniref:hypothetical protein n=1 Tax=Devosia sp. TaxID=1871048 RepID=UPI002FC9AFB7
MVVAPTVLWGQIKWLGHQFARLGQSVTGRSRTAAAVPAGFDGMAVEIPADADGSKRYIVSPDAGLVEKEKNGVTVVSRPEAAE